ncbi:MAG: tetratricopeptide repeat protein [Victivallaceae bacterium]
MKSSKILLMFLIAAIFAVNIYSAETPEVKYEEAWAVQLYNSGAFDKAFQLFQIGAKQNDAKAQYYLGRMYFEGDVSNEGVNYAKALGWYQKAAANGNAEAQACFAKMYFLGIGVPPDFDKAMTWYQKAADQGNAHGQYGLACMYYRVKKDYPKAMEWYKKVADQSNYYAQYSLACMYYYGEGTDKNFQQAAKWFKAAAEQGFPMAQYNLGVMFLKGQSVLQSDGIAVNWFRKAAANDCKPAIDALKDMGEDFRSGVPEGEAQGGFQRQSNDEFQPYNTDTWFFNNDSRR